MENVKQKCENFALVAAAPAAGPVESFPPRTWQGGNLLLKLALIPLENLRFVYLKGAHNSADPFSSFRFIRGAEHQLYEWF